VDGLHGTRRQRGLLDLSENLTVADVEPPETDELERLASAAYLGGRREEAYETWAAAHHAHTAGGDAARAARCAFWIAFGLLNSGALARGGGWVDRAQRLLDDASLDCVEHGHLRYARGLQAIFSGDGPTAHAGFTTALQIGDRFGDIEISTLARIGVGRCLIYQGDVAGGVALLDEAMVSVGAEEVSPIAVGDAYCTAIEGYYEVFDVRRTYEWTSALSRWCDAQPDLVMYRGHCLVHRAEVMQFHGEWSDAMDEIKRAADRLADPGLRMIGAEVYLRAELHRLRGEFGDAEKAFREANEHGRNPQPGLALLRLAQGNTDAAVATMRRVVEEADGPIARVRVLGPFVEVVLAAGDVDGARAAADELAELSNELTAPVVQAMAAQASGAVLVATGDGRAALKELRNAWAIWRELESPYEAARTRVLLSQACRLVGDDDGAAMELDAARSAYDRLGAVPDLARVDSMSGGEHNEAPGGLTAREVEVLRLVAKGKTNRAIADDLIVSEKTVASHLSHIFTKLDLTSRAAATAFAYENGLV
jgi:DNA-binding CsgD family transcriptional regulator/tetratricopeptide (TPR) repeat protein